MSTTRIATFEEFWPYYVREHASPANRALHFAGTTAAVLTAAAALLGRRPRLLPLALVAGYGPAWIGHFLVEGNRPATFDYPLWSLRADFVMWFKTATGQMDAEVARHAAPAEATNGHASNGHADAPVGTPGPERRDLN